MHVLVCGNVFDGLSDALTGPAEILVEDNRITKVERSVGRPPGARVIDLSERTVSPGFIDTHVHLTMDAANLALQTLQSSAAKALKGLSLAREYMNYGFTTMRCGVSAPGHRAEGRCWSLGRARHVRGHTVRAEPFDTVELRLGRWWMPRDPTARR